MFGKGKLRIRGISTLTLFIIVSLLALTFSGMVSAEDGYTGTTPTEEIKNLIFIILTLAFIVGGFVLSLIFYSIYKFREGNKHKRKPQVSENKRLEIIWTVIPALIITYLAVISTQALMVIDDPPEEHAMVIEVIGHQWFWEFVYPDGNISINEVHIEEGQLVIFELTSADVIHSFSLPEFYIKKDCLPEKTTKTWIRAEPAGTYQVFCAEFCGSSHHAMLAEVIIVEPEEGRKPYGAPENATDPGTPSGDDVGEHDHYYTPPSENREIYLYLFILIVIIVIITLALAFRPISDGKMTGEERGSEGGTEEEKRKTSGSKDAKGSKDAEDSQSPEPRAPNPEDEEANGDE
jgi:cytochrome c oxidase subunit 2